MKLVIISGYLTVLALLCVYGFHRLHLVLLLRRHAARLKGATRLAPVDLGCADLPRVTVQLPLYNEATVVARLLKAVSRVAYPKELLEIQVLDDSTDETRYLAQRQVAALRARGFAIHYLRRPARTGYKAGALDFGLQQASGELIAVFDADFLPQPNFLRETVGYFADPTVGMVQARWGHLNRAQGLLTRVQALVLDGHHLVENQARFAAGLFFNFSGTGGIWRRTAIVSAGGWQHDTITEDLDLSYRAQLAGWRFIYQPHVVTPAELPEEMVVFRTQQFRWAKGTIQTARKLLGQIWRAPVSWRQRLEATFHLTPHLAYPLMAALSLLLLPTLLSAPRAHLTTLLLIDVPLCLGSVGSLALFYMHAATAQGRRRLEALALLPAIIALGAGLSLHLTRAVLQGLRAMAGEFVRTPKKGSAPTRYQERGQWPIGELFFGALSIASAVVAVFTGHWLAAPFALLFGAGYWYVAAALIMERTGVGGAARAAARRWWRGKRDGLAEAGDGAIDSATHSVIESAIGSAIGSAQAKVSASGSALR